MEGIERVEIVLDYSPRSHFIKFHNRAERFGCLVAHRRAGKTVACINELIKAAITSPLENSRYGYIAPFFNQAKDIAWEYLKRYSAPIPGVGFNESELRVDFPNGSRIRLYGADNADRMRGVYFDGVILDEPAEMSPRVWPEIVRPALADRKGWAVFIGTPKGRNAFCEIFEAAEESADWFTMKLRASESGILDPNELNAAQEIMTEDQYAQEFECSFDAAIQGAYYAKLIAKAEEEGRIGNVPHEPALKVHTAWDLGMSDATTIWFAQQVGRELRLIDYYESSGKDLSHYVKVLSEKPYVYGEHLLPHDVEVRELTTGKSRLDVFRSLGLKVTALKADNVNDGINAVRMMLPKCWFDKTKCSRGLEALRQYRTEWDEKNKIFRDRPLHDWASHSADAFRYLATGLPDKKIYERDTPRYMRNRGQVSWMSA